MVARLRQERQDAKAWYCPRVQQMSSMNGRIRLCIFSYNIASSKVAQIPSMLAQQFVVMLQRRAEPEWLWSSVRGQLLSAAKAPNKILSCSTDSKSLLPGGCFLQPKAW